MKINRIVFVPILIVVFLVVAVIAGCNITGQSKVESGKPTDPSLLNVKQKGSLVVGTDIPYGVMEFYDEAGQPIGIDMDIAHEIASQIDVSMEVKKMPFDDLFDSLKAGEVDVVISAVTITPERQKEMLFSVPYLDAGLSIAVREDNAEINSLEDLGDKRVGVLKGTIGEDMVLESAYFDPSLVTSYQNNDERLQDLLEGKLDAIVVHFLVKDLPSIKTIGEPLSQSFYGVVTRLNNDALMDEINKTLRELKRSGKLGEIKQKYVNAAEE